jgi:hypothetical protein
MKSLSGIILTFSIVIFGIILLSIILTSLFIGSGYIISYLYNFTLFNATVLSLGTTFVSSFIIFIAIYSRYEDGIERSSQGSDDCDCQVCIYRREKLENKKIRRHKSK